MSDSILLIIPFHTQPTPCYSVFLEQFPYSRTINQSINQSTNP